MLQSKKSLGFALGSALLASQVWDAVAAAPAGPAFTVLSDTAAWESLPAPEKGAGQPLPSWARMTAESMPKTTAMMLRLDYVQRALSPLDPKLRAAMRYVIARTNQCEYAAAYALADARRAGLSESMIESLGKEDATGWTPDEKAALEFARKMSVASSTVTDDEFAVLVKAYGEKGAAAMVLLSAYGNFQDRLLICLRAPIEEGGPRPPAEFVFKSEPRSKVSGLVSKDSTIPTLAPPTGKDVVPDDSEWAKVTFEELQDRMERQRNRTARVRIPTWEEVQAAAPEYYPAGAKPVRVVWGLVCAGLQPRLAIAWNATMWTFWAEKAGVLPPAFSHSIFWVTTRAVDCPYCMGHCEMILELNGLTRSEIESRSRLLAGEDWSSFRPEEQRTFAFARKLAYAPATVAEDVETLKSDFGDQRAMMILWNACHGHYMVRVSNGFQLNLERDNVFRERLEAEASSRSDAPATPEPEK